MEIEKVPAIVIGAGVLGCALSRLLAQKGITPWVLESGQRIAEGITSRNSGVIHAGIYYKPKSLKARSCIKGSHLLYEWCERKVVPYRRCGKWIVGKKEESAEIEALLNNAINSGVIGLDLVSSQYLRTKLPYVDADCAIFSPNTGIVDPYEFSRSHRIAAEDAGAEFLFGCKVIGIDRSTTGYRVETTRGTLDTELIFNTAGLFSDEIAVLAGINSYKIYPCRGDYFRFSSQFKANELIYPIKAKGSPGLGIHLTIGINGESKLGPDAEYVDSKNDFSSREDKKGIFFEAAKKYLKELKKEDLQYDSCGIRPKLRGPRDSEELDFVVSEDLPGFINLVGIESPGLTASMALAEEAILKIS